MSKLPRHYGISYNCFKYGPFKGISKKIPCMSIFKFDIKPPNALILIIKFWQLNMGIWKFKYMESHVKYMFHTIILNDI